MAKVSKSPFTFSSGAKGQAKVIMEAILMAEITIKGEAISGVEVIMMVVEGKLIMVAKEAMKTMVTTKA